MFKCVGVFFILSLICVNVLSETPYESHTFTKFGSVAESKNDGDHRLPKSTVPKDYDLTLTVPLGSGVQKPEDQFKFEGKVIINLDVNEKTKTLTLHSKNLKINKGTLQKVETKPTTKSLTHTFDDKNDFLILAKTDSTDIVKGSYVLTIEFSGELSDDKFGLLRRSYTKENGEKQWLAVTNFQPDGARRAFPCFDEPAFRAKFKLTVVHSKSLSVLSNMPLYSENEVKGDQNKIKSVFEETPAMSTYTLAVIISDFVKIENNNFAVYGRSEVKKSLNLALEYGEKVIKSLEEYLGVKILDGYTKKIAQVAVPGYPSGALENWGLVLYNEQGLLYDEKIDVISKKQSVIQLVAHELAHQWFGNLVTPKWWQYLWLSEGFSDFFGSLIPDKLESTCRAVEQSVVENIHPLLQYDSGKTVPMNQNVETHDIFKKFDAISYTKASAVIRMMQHFLTEDVFKAGLQKYLTTKKLEAADSEDLFNALQKAVDEKKFPLEDSVNTIMNSWVNRAGYPVVTAGRIYGSKKIRLSQERFITYTAGEEGEENTGNWHIPINFATEGNPDFKNTSASIWLEHSGIEISTNVDSDKWIILNKQQTGYYRVNYDDHNWKLIIESLKSKDTKDLDTIHVLNRAQLLDDALAFVKTGSLDVKTLLNLTSYLKNETDYIAWKSGFDVISYFNDKLANTVYHSGFKTYALDLLEKFITKAIFKGDKEADHVIEINKAKIWNWACYLGHVDCTPVMKESLLKWLDQPAKNPISRDLFDVTLCHGLREADQATWTKVFEKSIKETDEDEKAKLFNALTCSNDPDILTKFLNSTLEPNSDMDTIDVALKIRDNSHVGVDTVLEFLLNRFIAIHLKYESNDVVIYLFREIGKKITTEKQLEKLSSAVDQDIDEKIVADGKEEAKKNIEWLNKHNSAFVWGDKVAPTDNQQKPNNGFTVNSASLGLVITVLLFTMNFIN